MCHMSSLPPSREHAPRIADGDLGFADGALESGAGIDLRSQAERAAAPTASLLRMYRGCLASVYGFVLPPVVTCGVCRTAPVWGDGERCQACLGKQ